MVIHNIQFLQGDHNIMGDNDNTPETSGNDSTGATSPEEVVESVREQVAPDAAPVESAPTPERVEETTTTSTTVTEPVSDDSSTPDN